MSKNVKKRVSAYEKQGGKKKSYPEEAIITIVDPYDPNNKKRIVPKVYLEAPYIEIKTQEEFQKYFGGVYDNEILPYLGTNYRVFIDEERHPRRIKSEEAILKKALLIEGSGIADSIKADLKEDGLSENNMSLKELEAYIEKVKIRRKAKEELVLIVNKSGRSEEVQRALSVAGKSLSTVTKEEIIKLLKDIELSEKEE